MGNLERHAEEELRRAGLFDKDSDYGGMLAPAVMRMIKIFAAEGHSGMSASITLDIFTRLASFKTLTPITNDPAEWLNVSEYGPHPAYQNRRDSTCFSEDGGKTYYSIDDPKREIKTTPDAKKPGGFIPIIVLLVFGAAAGFVIGVKIQDRIIHETEVCHQPGPGHLMSTNERPDFPWPSMSVPNYDGGGR